MIFRDFSWFYLVEAICKLTTPGYGRMCAELHMHIKTLYSKTSLSFSASHYSALHVAPTNSETLFKRLLYIYIMYLHIHIHTIYISYTYHIHIIYILHSTYTFSGGQRDQDFTHAKRPWPWPTLWLMTHTTHTGEFLPAAHGVILNPGRVNNVTMAPWHTNTWIAITFPGSLSPTCFLPKNVFLILDDFSLCHSSYVFVLSTFLVVILPSNQSQEVHTQCYQPHHCPILYKHGLERSSGPWWSASNK